MRTHHIDLDGQLPEVINPTKNASDRLNELVATNLTFHYPDSDNGIEGIDLTLKRLKIPWHRTRGLRYFMGY